MMSEVSVTTSSKQWRGQRVRCDLTKAGISASGVGVVTGTVSDVTLDTVIINLDHSVRLGGELLYSVMVWASALEDGCHGYNSTGKYTSPRNCTAPVKEQGLCGKHLGIKKRKATMEAKRDADVQRIIASWKDSIKQANALKSYGVECSAHVNGEVILSAAGTQLFIDMLFNATAGA